MNAIFYLEMAHLFELKYVDGDFKNELADEIIEWLRENKIKFTEGNFIVNGDSGRVSYRYGFGFKKQEDLIAFKLRWL